MPDREPNAYEEILAACPAGSKKYWNAIPDDYQSMVLSSLKARIAGCNLGAIVEGWSLEKMENYAKEIGVPYPMTNYWPSSPDPEEPRYILGRNRQYTAPEMKYSPVDDDTTYTILGLIIAEEAKNFPFTLQDVADAWLKYLPMACTAEKVTLDNLKAGAAPEKAAEINNPYDEWIGADIRCDGFAYMAPGNPRLAAKLAYTDAYISHRKNGIYGEMYFAAVISSAFALKDPKAALEAGLLEIPENCDLAEAVRWALSLYGKVKDYREAAKLVDERFPNMSPVHTINNACLTIFALGLGHETKSIDTVISQCVAMAHDCDCTAATAGSIAGAAWGIASLSPHWYEPFNDIQESYLIGRRVFGIEDLSFRFALQARRHLALQ